MSMSEQKQVEEFIANMLSIGMKRDQAVEKGYDFAVALLRPYEQVGTPISATMMYRASELVKNALPGAHRLYDLRNQMR